MTYKISLNNLDDLIKHQEDIKNEEYKIGKFEGKIIAKIRNTIRDKISQYINIKFLRFQRPFNKENFRDEIYIKGDYYKENNWDNSKLQLKKNKDLSIAFITIELKNGRDFTKNSKIEFKFISQNRTNHGENKEKFQYEIGKNRFILLDKIKETIIDRYKNDVGSMFKSFKVKVDDKELLQDSFSYNFSTETLIIDCVDRDYENNYWNDI